MFLRFAGLAGLGWLLDATLLLCLVTFTGLSPGYANVLSSSTAALSVFVVSRQTIFNKASRFFLLRVLAYALYTLLVIFAASAVVGLLVPWLSTQLVGMSTPTRVAAVATGLAKIIVTPPQLLMNFCVSKFMSERRVAPPDEVGELEGSPR